MPAHLEDNSRLGLAHFEQITMFMSLSMWLLSRCMAHEASSTYYCNITGSLPERFWDLVTPHVSYTERADTIPCAANASCLSFGRFVSDFRSHRRCL